jgi:hypothetical protein
MNKCFSYRQYDSRQLIVFSYVPVQSQRAKKESNLSFFSKVEESFVCGSRGLEVFS